MYSCCCQAYIYSLYATVLHSMLQVSLQPGDPNTSSSSLPLQLPNLLWGLIVEHVPIFCSKLQNFVSIPMEAKKVQPS